MASHQSLATVAALGFIAMGCGLDTAGLASAYGPADQLDAGTDTEPAASSEDGGSATDAQGTGPTTHAMGTQPAMDATTASIPEGGSDQGSTDEGGDLVIDDAPATPELDAGSPTDFTVGPGAPTKQWGDSSGASLLNVACPASEVIIGFTGIVSTDEGYWINIAAECGMPSFEPGAVSVTVLPGLTLPPEGPTPPAAGTTPARGACAANEVVVGFTAKNTLDGHIHEITIDCAPLTIEGTGSSAAGWSTLGVTLTLVGGGPPPNATELTSTDIRCANDPAAVASQTNNAFDGLGLVVFGLECSALTAQ
jgi:hypothetical protein